MVDLHLPCIHVGHTNKGFGDWESKSHPIVLYFPIAHGAPLVVVVGF
jgi:hypothetical protein